MTFANRCGGVLFAITVLCSALSAQRSDAPQGTTTVPRLVSFSGKATDAQGKVISGIAGATFAIYKDQSEGSPLWLETQNVQADSKGKFTVQLGATKPEGLPLDLFSSGDARWLGVTINGGKEQARVLLLSVPYALKAADAETVGGLLPSAFVLAAPANTLATAGGATSPSASPSPLALAGGGTLDFVPLWTPNGTTLGNSVLFQSGSGSTAKIGINSTTPASTLDVNGGETVRGNLSLPATGTANAMAGKNSQSTTYTASVFNKTTGTAVAQNFRWQAEPVGNDTSTANGSLNLLYAAGSNPVAETGLKVGSNGQITFAASQTFPGTGTVSSVGLSAPASDFTVSGSPVTKSGTLNLSWNVAPTNLNTPNAIVKRDASGDFTADTITANGKLYALANTGNGNAITGTSASPIATVVYGGASSSTGATWGVEGETYSFDLGTSGVVGRAHNGGVGVYGLNEALTGMAGVYGQLNQTTTNFGPLPTAGVWGSSGYSGFLTTGVLATADDSTAAYFVNNSNAYPTLDLTNDDSSGYLLSTLNVPNSAYCTINNIAHLICTGGTSAAVPLDDGKRKVAMSAIESPENWFEDFGSAQLVNGVAVVQLDPDFIQTVNAEKNYRVFPVPNGDCKGLYVTNKTANSFEVHELGGGTSNVSFDYRITAIRKNYEAVRFADHTNDPDPRKMLERMGKAKPLSSPAPALVKPASPAAPGVPLAQLANK